MPVDYPRAIAALEGLSQAMSPAGQYAAIRASFIISLSSAAADYLDGRGDLGTTKRAANSAVVTAYGAVADVVAGGPLEPDDLTFFNAEVAQERTSIQTFWADLKLQRASGDTSLPGDRIELYGRSLDALFNELSARQQKNAFGTWELGDTETHCTGRGSCTWLDGQRHRMSWFLSHNYIPRKPGAAQNCGGWRCQCGIKDDAGNMMLVEA